MGVVLCDQRMAGTKGTEFLARVKEMYPQSMRMILSGYTDLNAVLEAVNQGAVFKFLMKPWDDDVLRRHIKEAFEIQESRRLARAPLP